jgi:hypothetical protein
MKKINYNIKKIFEVPTRLKVIKIMGINYKNDVSGTLPTFINPYYPNDSKLNSQAYSQRDAKRIHGFLLGLPHQTYTELHKLINLRRG